MKSSCSLLSSKAMLGSLLLLSLFPVVFCGSLDGYTTLDRFRIDTRYFIFLFDATGAADCVKKGCQSDRPCFWAFNKKHLKCYSVNFQLGIFLVNALEMMKPDMKWTLIYPNNAKKSKAPFNDVKILWLLDNISKGRNFGTAVSAVNIPTNNVVWKRDAKGPRASNPLLYAGGNQKKQAVSIYIGGNYVVDMLDIVTIAMWIKTDGKSGDMCLLCGDPSYSARFFLSSTGKMDMLGLAFDSNGDDYTTTDYNDKHVNVKDWRHVAVTYKSASATFYLNGNVWPILYERKHYDKMIRPSKLVMWTTTTGKAMKYYGKIACVAVFQSFLRKDEINVLKDNCP